MAHRDRSHPDDGSVASDRSTAYWGLGFVLLLLLSAGMVTVPGGEDSVGFVRGFYRDHAAVIVIAQVVGLVAAVTFLPFARALQRGRLVVGGGRPVLATGTAVAGAAVLAGVPPLVLVAAARSGGAGTVSALATASDLVDVVLFTAIATFATAVAVFVTTTWVRAVAGVVALLSLARAVLLLAGSGALELVAPLGFVALVLCLAWAAWRRRRPPT